MGDWKKILETSNSGCHFEEKFIPLFKYFHKHSTLTLTLTLTSNKYKSANYFYVHGKC